MLPNNPFTYAPLAERPAVYYRGMRSVNRNSILLTLPSVSITTQPTVGGYCAVNYDLTTLLPAGFTIVKGQRFVGLTGVVPCVSWVADGRQYRYKLADRPGALPFDYYGGQLIAGTKIRFEYWANGLANTVSIPELQLALGTLSSFDTTTTYVATACVNAVQGSSLNFASYMISCA